MANTSIQSLLERSFKFARKAGNMLLCIEQKYIKSLEAVITMAPIYINQNSVLTITYNYYKDIHSCIDAISCCRLKLTQYLLRTGVDISKEGRKSKAATRQKSLGDERCRFKQHISERTCNNSPLTRTHKVRNCYA